ncbi:WAT1-related protein [Dichanthelium oligosanthes]|uniref:WAT1-related protein n=1 Tax=Dichanthelium oligosanthes TaxID=888268 RepID=A0A1E5UW59_9POAL|nr:WAT1-related protein [Dichanthelium oligosanthes]
MDGKKPSMIAIFIQVMYTDMFIISKAAFNNGMNTFVFIFYGQTAVSLLLVPLAVLLEWITLTFNLYNVSLKLTSATVASASTNSMPVITFCLALLLRMEEVKLRSPSGIAKLTGVALCLAGVLVITFYAGPLLSPVRHHSAFAGSTHASATAMNTVMRAAWVKGMFISVLSVLTLSLWMVLQASVLKEFPNKMLVTVTQCVFSMAQLFVVAVIAERDFSMWKLRLDIGMLAVGYSYYWWNPAMWRPLRRAMGSAPPPAMAICPLLKNVLCCAGGLAVGGAVYYMMYQRKLEEERRQALAVVYELDDHDFEILRRKYEEPKPDSVPAPKRKR